MTAVRLELWPLLAFRASRHRSGPVQSQALQCHFPLYTVGVVMETPNLALTVAHLKPTKWDFGRDKEDPPATDGEGETLPSP
jgi:hypothetical protein